MKVQAKVIAIAPSATIVPRRIQVSVTFEILTFLCSSSFRVVLTVNSEAADSIDESAEDITAAATAARPKIFN